jgi:N-glycosylase/DNA lyase
MSAYAPQLLSTAVAAICPDIQSRVADAVMPGERRLWWELSSCILSSQVPYALAIAAADAIDAERVFSDSPCEGNFLAQRLVQVLSTPLVVDGRSRAYRFPVIRARQLAATHAAITKEACSLRALVDGFSNAVEARTWMVKHAPGIGPKQASMFLRNIGMSYDLAILDRHVLNYMSVLGIYRGSTASIGGLRQYCQHESVLRDHARAFSCPVGLLDWAIWIVMRVASRKEGSVVL